LSLEHGAYARWDARDKCHRSIAPGAIRTTCFKRKGSEM
jgi:hypothetical protein